jgi:multidrug efflux system membrane fusion protein
MEIFTMIRRLLPALMLVLILPACGAEKPPEQKIIRPVRYQEVRTAGGGLERSFAGTAKAGVESRLSFRVPGSIEKVAVKVGDRVGKGDLIARLDDTDYRLQVQEALAALANARAQSRNADATYERVRALYENRNASRNDLDAARAASESAEAAVRASATRVELTRSQLGYTRLTAPVSGAIAAVPAEVNENVSAGQVVVVLTSGALPEVISAIPESLISLVRRDMPVTVRFDALGDRTFPARVTEVGVAAISRASTFPVTARLEESSPMIRPGMAAEVTFLLSRTDDDTGFLVPPEAVGEDREGRFVLVIEAIDKELGIVHRRAVTVGELRADGLEVSSGLKKGDRVVTAGASRLDDGQKVRLLPGGGETP